MKSLAIFGGKKAVKIPFPHYVWPEKNKKLNTSVYKYLNNMKNGKLGLPDIIEKFEKRFKNFHKSNYALALSSGTAALHTAYYALGVGPGDEVIVPNYTFPATALPILVLGAKPVLCDCLTDTANIDPLDIKRKITKKTKAISITHWWGHPCEMREILKISKNKKIPIVEDCAHAPGAKYRGKLVGTFGDVSCFSLDNNKLLASGEGGVLLTNSKKIYEKSVLFSDFGPRLQKQVKSKKLKNFTSTGVGTKYRIHFLAAKIADEKFKIINSLNKDREKIFKYFSKKLSNTKSLVPPQTKSYVKRGGFYGFKATFNRKIIKKINKVKYLKFLKAEGVDVRKTATPPLHFTALFSNQKNYYLSNNSKKKKFLKKNKYFPNSTWYENNHLSFPTFYSNKHKKIIDQYLLAIKKIENYFKL